MYWTTMRGWWMKMALLATIGLAALMRSAKAAAAVVEKAKKIRVEASIGHFGYLPFNKWLLADSGYAQYSTCDGYELSQYNVERSCELTLVSIDDKAVSRNKSCRVQFRVNERAAEKFLPLVRGDQVVLPHVYFSRRNERSFPTEMYLKYRIVNMSTCKSHELKLLVNPEFVVRNNLLYFHSNVVLRERGLGVFVPNDGLCRGALCQLTYDAGGQSIAAPTSYLAEAMTGSFVQLFPTSAPNAYFALVLEWKKRRPGDAKRPYGDAMQVVYASDSKSIRLIEFGYKAGFTELFADLSNGLFAVCRKYSLKNSTRTIYCAQFDENRNSKMDTAFSLSNSTRPIALYNIPRGGLLLISGQCGHKSDENLCQNLIFQQIKLNGKGKVRHIHHCEYNVPLSAFAKDGEDGQLCVSLYHSCDNDKFQVFFMKKCYAKKLFF